MAQGGRTWVRASLIVIIALGGLVMLRSDTVAADAVPSSPKQDPPITDTTVTQGILIFQSIF